MKSKKDMEYDVIIVGAGPAGLFASYKLDNLKVLIIDEKSCPGGAGAITDGKLNLSTKIGMDLKELNISEEYGMQKINEIDEAFLRHGADPKLSGTDHEKIKFWINRSKEYGMELVSVKQRHMGTDVTHLIVKNFQKELESKGITFLLKTWAKSIEKKRR